MRREATSVDNGSAFAHDYAMSIIAPTSPTANPNTPDPDPNQGHNAAGIPGAAPGAKWVANADDAKAADKSSEVNPHPKSSEEADADARKVQPENQTPAAAAPPQAAIVEPTAPAVAPHRGNRNG